MIEGRWLLAKRIAQGGVVTSFLTLSAIVTKEMVEEHLEEKRNAPPQWTDKNRWPHGE